MESPMPDIWDDEARALRYRISTLRAELRWTERKLKRKLAGYGPPEELSDSEAELECGWELHPSMWSSAGSEVDLDLDLATNNIEVSCSDPMEIVTSETPELSLDTSDIPAGTSVLYSSTSPVSSVPVANIGGVLYYQLDTGRGIVGKRVVDGWLNISQILDVAQVTDWAKRQALERARASCETSVQYGPLNRALGTWAPFEYGLTLIEEHGLKDLLVDLLVPASSTECPTLDLPALQNQKSKLLSLEPIIVESRQIQFLRIDTSIGPILKRLDTNWLNVTQILIAAGLGTIDRVKELDWLRKYSVCEVKNGGAVEFRGMFISYPEGVALAKKWNALDLISPLLLPVFGVNEEDIPAPDDKIAIVVSLGRQYYHLHTPKGLVTKRVDDDWFNATQILRIAGLDKTKRKQELNQAVRTYRHHEIVANSGHFISGTWVPYDKGVQLARKWGVIELISPLLGDLEEYEDDEVDPDTVLKWDEVAGHEAICGSFAAVSSVSSSNKGERHVAVDIGQLVVISRNSGAIPNGRARLLRDGLKTAESFCAAFGLNPDIPTTVVGFNGLSSTKPAIYDSTRIKGNNADDRDRLKIIEAVRSTPKGMRCMMIVRGLDGWTTNVASLRGFASAFEDVDLWFASAVPQSWSFSDAWVLELTNCVRYNIVSFKELATSLPSSPEEKRWSTMELVKVLDYINMEKSTHRGSHIGWLTRIRSKVL